jgi:hypothetical protein
MADPLGRTHAQRWPTSPFAHAIDRCPGSLLLGIQPDRAEILSIGDLGVIQKSLQFLYIDLTSSRAIEKVHAIGNFNPISRAHSFAISYPASACRMTPVPGSFQSTREMRASAASLPSHTITTPLCCE